MPASIKNALTDLLNDRKTPLDELVTRHFTANYRQRTNGIWDDRAGFLAHIHHLRNVVSHVDITVLDEIESREKYSSRHIVDVEKTDSSQVVQEVYLFAQLASDGRFDTVEEVTMMLSGSEADRNLGNAR